MSKARTRVRWPLWRAVVMFAAAGLVAVVVVAFGVGVASRHAGTDTAIRDARRETSVLARAAITPTLTDALVNDSQAAVAAMDVEVRSRVIDQNLVRVKLWRADGHIVYSDDRQVMGKTYTLGQDEVDALRTGASAADVSDLSLPENRFDRKYGKLLEVYQPVRTPNGTPLLFETYFRYDVVAAGSRRAWNDFAPIMLAGLIGLEALQIPLAWSMARRLQASQSRQEHLLRHAIDSSDLERRRIARDLHDGVVQDLASVSFSLASIGGALPDADAEALHEAATGTRRSIRALRSLLVEIYPPSLQAEGLASALSDLTAGLSAQRIEANVDLPDDLHFAPDVEALLYRATQEALRNVVAHARAQRVDIRLTRADQHAVLDVVDDGIGFDPNAIRARSERSHVGLRVLGDLAAEAGGHCNVTSRPGSGTHLHLEVPER